VPGGRNRENSFAGAGPDPSREQIALQGGQGAEIEIASEDELDGCRLGVLDDQLTVFARVAEGRKPSVPPIAAFTPESCLQRAPISATSL
jgi:hypothetical protein